MSTEPAEQPRIESPRPIGTGKAILIALGLYLVCITAMVLAEELGRHLAGDAGGWTGWGLAFAATCVVCAIITLRFAAHPNMVLAVLCAVLPSMAAGGKAEEYARTLDWGGWAKVAFFVVFFSVYTLWFVVLSLLAKRRS